MEKKFVCTDQYRWYCAEDRFFLINDSLDTIIQVNESLYTVLNDKVNEKYVDISKVHHMLVQWLINCKVIQVEE